MDSYSQLTQNRDIYFFFFFVLKLYSSLFVNNEPLKS